MNIYIFLYYFSYSYRNREYTDIISTMKINFENFDFPAVFAWRGHNFWL